MSSVQITMAEAFGVEGRGALYEELGAVRDVVQNHLLQVVSLLGHGTAGRATSLDRCATSGSRSCTRFASPHLQTWCAVSTWATPTRPGSSPSSTTETYAALRLHIDSWRWNGVPVLIRAGKQLPVTATEVLATFHRPPQRLFDETLPRDSNHLRFRLGPDRVSIALGVRSKRPGEVQVGRNVELYTCDDEVGTMTRVRTPDRRRDGR